MAETRKLITINVNREIADKFFNELERRTGFKIQKGAAVEKLMIDSIKNTADSNRKSA